jgi:hypothetical protein
MCALARLAGLVTVVALVSSTPELVLGQETGSDVQVISGIEVVSSVSFALVAGPAAAAGPAPTPQAFAVAVQATITQVMVASGGEAQARTQLGDFRTSILMKAGVLTFDRARAAVGARDADPTTSAGSGGN